MVLAVIFIALVAGIAIYTIVNVWWYEREERRRKISERIVRDELDTLDPRD
jgi:Flp pilus assembly protein TadB